MSGVLAVGFKISHLGEEIDLNKILFPFVDTSNCWTLEGYYTYPEGPEREKSLQIWRELLDNQNKQIKEFLAGADMIPIFNDDFAEHYIFGYVIMRIGCEPQRLVEIPKYDEKVLREKLDFILNAMGVDIKAEFGTWIGASS